MECLHGSGPGHDYDVRSLFSIVASPLVEHDVRADQESHIEPAHLHDLKRLVATLEPQRFVPPFFVREVLLGVSGGDSASLLPDKAFDDAVAFVEYRMVAQHNRYAEFAVVLEGLLV